MKFELNKRSFSVAILAILIFATFLRFAVSRELVMNDPQVRNPGKATDMATYKLYSEQVVKGEYNGPYYYQPFYYAVFLPSIKYLFGYKIWPVIISQILLSVMTIWFAALASAMLWGRRAGVITSLLLAFSSILVLYVPFYLIATLQAFWIALIFLLLLKNIKFEQRTIEPQNVKSNIIWGILGIVIGLAILTRGNVWFFIPGIVVAIIIARSKSCEKRKMNPTTGVNDSPLASRSNNVLPVNTSLFTGRFLNFLKRYLPLLTLIVMILLPQLPFAWRNSVIQGKLSGPSTAAGAVLSLGNTPESPPGGRDPGTGPGPMEYPQSCGHWLASQKEHSVFSRIFDRLIYDTVPFLELQLRKMLLFWDRREIPNNVAIEYQGSRSQSLQISGLIPFDFIPVQNGKIPFITMNIIPTSIFLLVFTCAGIIFYLMNIVKKSDNPTRNSLISVIKNNVSSHLGISLLLYFILSYWLGTAAFYILARFRVPILPICAILAGGFINYIFYSLSRRKPFLKPIFITFIAFLFVNFGYDFYRYNLEASVYRVIQHKGVVSYLDKKILLKDNGPQSFGSWHPIEICDNDFIAKKFAVSDDKWFGKKATFQIDIYWKVPGSCDLIFNGDLYRLSERSSSKQTYSFPVIVGHDIEMEFTNLDCKIFLLADYQRYHARTKLNKKILHCELVSELLIPKLKK